MLIYSNSRITEAKETLRAEMGKSSAELRSDMRELQIQIRDLQNQAKDLRIQTNNLQNQVPGLREDMKAGFGRIEEALRVHVLEHHR
jgi:uncharacterized coiled-coil DUF342 family protein